MASKDGGPGTSGRGAAEEIDVSKLSKSKIKQMAASDPKFIQRLITQLDNQMLNMVRKKQQKQEEIATDMTEIARLDQILSTNINPNLERLDKSIQEKTLLRDQLRKQLASETKNLKQMQSEASALIQSTRAITTKLRRATASQSLEEARGFSSKTSTSDLIKSTKRQP